MIQRLSARTSQGKRGQQSQALGCSCGGFSTKIHAVCDALGNPISFSLTAGQVSDYKEALSLIDGFKTSAILADKGYDADYVIEAAVRCGAQAIIPTKSNRKTRHEYDKALYKERNLIERLFNKLKLSRRVATPYDKTASVFLGFIHLAAICLWLN